MSSRRQNSNKIKPFRKRAIALLALFAAVAAVSPAAAAAQLVTLDNGMLAMIVAFATLLLTVVFEVWRLGAHKTQPARNRATQDWKSDHRN